MVQKFCPIAMIFVLNLQLSFSAMAQNAEIPASNQVAQYDEAEPIVQGPFWGAEDNSISDYAQVAPSVSKYSVTGGLVVTDQSSAFDLSVSRRSHRYLATTWHAYSHRVNQEQDSENFQSKSYGARILWEIWVENPTVVIPVLGLGPGFEYWLHERNEKAFKRSATFTAHTFFGLALRLTKHFGIQIRKLRHAYLTNPPPKLTSRSPDKQDIHQETQVQFTVWF